MNDKELCISLSRLETTLENLWEKSFEAEIRLQSRFEDAIMICTNYMQETIKGPTFSLPACDRLKRNLDTPPETPYNVILLR